MRMLQVVTLDQRVVTPTCCRGGMPVVEVRVEVRTESPRVRGSFWKRIDHGCSDRVENVTDRNA